MRGLMFQINKITFNISKNLIYILSYQMMKTIMALFNGYNITIGEIYPIWSPLNNGDLLTPAMIEVPHLHIQNYVV